MANSKIMDDPRIKALLGEIRKLVFIVNCSGPVFKPDDAKS